MNRLTIIIIKVYFILLLLFLQKSNSSSDSSVEKNFLTGDGQKLFIKNYPEISDIQSGIYEIFQPPYNLEINHQAAIAHFDSNDNDIKGDVIFFQKHPPNGPVFIRGNLTGLTGSRHGLHIHQSGDVIRQGCQKLGGHFNPHLLQHGGPKSFLRHVGDLGNLEVNKENGVAEIVRIDPLISLGGGVRGVVGRGLVVTEHEDDLGLTGNANSLLDGNSGNAIACTVIAYIR